MVAGYENGDQLWTNVSCKPHLGNIKVPVFAITTKDDVITPIDFFPETELRQNPNFVSAVTEKGGHCEFFYHEKGEGYKRYTTQIVFKYFKEIERFL